MTRARLHASAAATLTIAAALGIRATEEGAFAKYAGVALYTVLLYALVVAARPRVRPMAAAAVALGLSWAMEFAQLSPLPEELSARNGLLRLVFGSTFHAPDLFWYVVGAVCAYGVHRAYGRAAGRAPAGRVPTGR
ncbi:DUF2809 domain-containing protein [Streptomyces sp. CA-294286]|uniref:ribosomal maturation YjgA family protein n=1 Tax=Streptomyces sp. CA-294286 TaxID=3240070 RepID=UPI003D8F833A